ncbi:hypothetical protein D3C87_2106460 [compost metagenome]
MVVLYWSWLRSVVSFRPPDAVAESSCKPLNGRNSARPERVFQMRSVGGSGRRKPPGFKMRSL